MRLAIAMVLLAACGGTGVVADESLTTASAATLRWRVVEYPFSFDGTQVVIDRTHPACFGTLLLDATTWQGTITCSSRCADDGSTCTVPTMGATAYRGTAQKNPSTGNLEFIKDGNTSWATITGFDFATTASFEAMLHDPYAPQDPGAPPRTWSPVVLPMGFRSY